MLTSLTIKNYILIEQLDINLTSGFSVLSGETGAGKSIIIDALKVFLQKKTDLKIKKEQDKITSIIASFEADNFPKLKNILAESFIIIEDEIILKKIITEENKVKAFINGEPVNNKLLNICASHLFEIHGQHDTSSLFEEKNHLEYIDNFIKDKEILKSLAHKFNDLYKIKKEAKEIREGEEKLKQEIIYLAELEKDLTPLQEHNFAELIEKKNNLKKHKETINIYKNLSQKFSSGSPIISEIISSQKSLINNIEKDEENFNKILNCFEKILSSFDEVEKNIDFDPYALENSEVLDELVSEFKSKSRKYAIVESNVAEFLTESLQKLEDYKNKISKLGNLDKDILAKKKEFLEICDQVNKQREKIIKNLEDSIHKYLGGLYMDKTNFKVASEIQEENFYNKKGNIFFHFSASTNPGQPFNKLVNIASGGELSRFMLALKLTLLNDKKTLIFDEIDTGISGKVADAVGKQLKLLSQKNQIIVITHQAQVAAKSNNHYLVEKSQQKDNTSLSIRVLNGEEKLLEVARIIAGEEITNEAIAAAKKLQEND